MILQETLYAFILINTTKMNLWESWKFRNAISCRAPSAPTLPNETRKIEKWDAHIQIYPINIPP